MAHPTCKRCGHPHYNFMSCDVASQERGIKQKWDAINLTPTLHREGWHPWHQNQKRTENVRMYGDLQVIKSNLKREGWKESA